MTDLSSIGNAKLTVWVSLRDEDKVRATITFAGIPRLNSAQGFKRTMEARDPKDRPNAILPYGEDTTRLGWQSSRFMRISLDPSTEIGKLCHALELPVNDDRDKRIALLDSNEGLCAKYYVPTDPHWQWHLPNSGLIVRMPCDEFKAALLDVTKGNKHLDLTNSSPSAEISVEATGLPDILSARIFAQMVHHPNFPDLLREMAAGNDVDRSTFQKLHQATNAAALKL